MLPMMQDPILLVGIRFCALATGGFGQYRWRINHNGFIVTNDHASCLTPVFLELDMLWCGLSQLFFSTGMNLDKATR